MSAPGVRADGLTEGWQVARTAPDQCAGPESLAGCSWIPARVPGTAAGAVGDNRLDADAEDWWFRCVFQAEPAAAGEEVTLALDGLATVAEVYLNGRRVLDSESMFAAHELDVGDLLTGDNELAICCRALAPRLAARRRPRARWRTRVVAPANLRFYRTMLLGRAPGFAPGPAVVGPWRPVTLRRRRGVVIEQLRLRSGVHGDNGVLRCEARLRGAAGAQLPEGVLLSARGPTGEHRVMLPVMPGADGGSAVGELVIDDAERWWPHTHGSPCLYAVTLGDGDVGWCQRRVGFRSLDSAGDIVADGPDLHVNGEPVFARGAVWTPLSLSAPHGDEAQLRAVLRRVTEGGLNMLRLAGLGTYESDTFYDLCDELGILVWQDFMFANLDYPEADGTFMAAVRSEAEAVMARLGSRPSLAVVCGGSEVAQQVTMLGLDPALAQGPLYAELLPSVVAAAEVDAPYVPSAPWGGELPFRTDRGVANYYGVGAYCRPLSDARLSEVRFAAECLAFANVPDDDALAALAAGAAGGPAADGPAADGPAADGPAVGGEAWKSGVPRDVGAGWDFDDVRDHYLKRLLHLDPGALRGSDPERYLELSRAVSGEVMAEVFGEWRRSGSPCRGALVLWLKDHRPGAGWGLLDHRGVPKVAYHHVRRALAPVAVWSTDEGLGGIAVHVANDAPRPLTADLRVALYRDFRQLVGEAHAQLRVPPHGGWEANVESLLGRFVDVGWTYRFGPPAQDLVVLSLERDGEPLSQAFRCPLGPPVAPGPPSQVGLRGCLEPCGGGGARLRVSSDAFAYGVRVLVPGYVAADDAFGVEPGHERTVKLRAQRPTTWPPTGARLTALNLRGAVRIAVDDG